MDNQESYMPFGLLFEEPAPQPQALIIPTYSEEGDLSYVENLEGQWVPYVELAGVIATETITRNKGEAVDEDQNYYNGQFFGFGTETITLIEEEATDTDPEDDQEFLPFWRSLMGTETVTKEAGEATDKD